MKTKKLLLGISVATLGAVAITVVATNQTTLPSKATTQTSYSCASIHFGMNDSTRKALTYDCSTQLTADNIASVCIQSGVEIIGGNYTKTYLGDASSTDYAIKIGASSAKGTMDFYLDHYIIGLTCYVLGYKTDNASITINGVSQSITQKYANPLTKANAEEVEYYPYTWTFEEQTNHVGLEATNKSKCRFFLADISFRVVGQVEL